MRSLPMLFLLIFLFFYLIITIGEFWVIKKITAKNKRKIIQWIFWIFNLLMALAFVYLYIYPNQPRDVKNYVPYFYFNSLLFADFIVKILLSVFLLPYFIFRKSDKKKMFLYAGLIFSAGVILNVIYGLTAGNKNLRITKYELEFQELPKAFDNYRIVQMSDIHLGSMFNDGLMKEAQHKIDALNPDLLIFTGDMVNNFAYETSGWIEYFSSLTKSVPSYSILGNHDYGDYTTWKNKEEKKDNFKSILLAEQKMGFTLLRNEHVVLTKNKDSIYLVGVENWGHKPFPQYADMEKAMKNVSEDAFKILLSHDPAHWESKVKFNPQINLVFSGHTHGLQWGIKPAGIPFSFSYLTRKNWGGLYESENSELIVSTGMGSVGIPWRIEMPPEITFFILKRSKID